MPCGFKSRRDDILFNIFKNISLIIINFYPIPPEASHWRQVKDLIYGLKPASNVAFKPPT